MYTSNKTLLQILVEELPKRGGWPEGVKWLAQTPGGSILGRETRQDGPHFSLTLDTVAKDQFIAKVTRDQYEAALAASKAVVGHNGWIDWHGGECPVDSDAIVEVKFRKPCPLHFSNDRAGDFVWSHHGSNGDIIAYRLVNKHELEIACIDVQRDAVKSNDAQLEADLNDCIGQPQEDIKTIRAEMLAVLNDTRLTMNLRAAMKLVDAFIDAGYRKQ